MDVIKIDAQLYKKITDFFKNKKSANIILKIMYKGLPYVIFAAYGLLLLYLALTQSAEIFKITLVPLGVFLFVTIIRKFFNRERPYEKFGIPSVFNKTKKGESMPSRHTASAFIISMAFLCLSPPLGIIFLCISFLIMLSRVFAGVHFISDVLAGMTLSVVSGYVFLFLI
ncbi:MAG: phosphatase PAP2 family protein [Ruminococcus sp.]|nr:phosphatase PAP2 family protein [Ruminococcus sp.]